MIQELYHSLQFYFINTNMKHKSYLVGMKAHTINGCVDLEDPLTL